MLKVVTILGARPQFIKASVVSNAFAANGNVKEIIVHTGQHFDKNMSDIFFDQMKISKPNYMLKINSGQHGDMTGKMLIEIEKVLIKESPDWVLVYGDTNSTLAGSLAATKLHIKIAHVEAGLRSFNMDMPEEINRILTDRVSNKLFCPTQLAKNNLSREGYDALNCDIYLSGDVMLDAALYYSAFNTDNDSVNEIVTSSEDFLLATIHRAENTNDIDNLKNIFSALDSISSDMRVIMPLHPRTKKYLSQYKIKSKVEFIDPVGYVEMLKLLNKCQLVITDSGGLQKEAYFFNKYCLTARDETEWVELIDNGFNTLVGANSNKIVNAYDTYRQMDSNTIFENKKDLYGDGHAAESIVNDILSD